MKLSYEFIVTVTSLLTTIAITLLSFMTYVRIKSERKLKERYDFEKHLVELDYMRKNMEMQLYDISKKIEENANRWKDVNHLIISSQNKLETANSNESKVSPNEFLKSLGLINPQDFEVDNRQVFVLTPFNDNYREVFFTIREVCNKMHLKCIRGDEEYIPNDIFPQILKQIVTSRLIIANITGRNPNVMYELGVAHALGKPTIIVSHNFTEIPFDIGYKRIIIYDNSKDLQNKLETSITDLLISKVI